MSSTPCHSPGSRPGSTSKSEEPVYDEYDQEEEAGLIANFGENGLALSRFYRAHHWCPHEDEACYFGADLHYFVSRDILIKNSRGEILAGVPEFHETAASSIYRWMAMVYLPTGGWELRRVSDGLVIPRSEHLPLTKGDYIPVDSEHNEVELDKINLQFRLRPLSQTSTPLEEDVRFAEPLLRQYSTEMVWPHAVKIPKVDIETTVNHIARDSEVDWARIYPVASFEDWMLKLPSEARAEPERMQNHFDWLSSAGNALILPKCMHLNFSEHYWGCDVGDNFRIIRFVGKQFFIGREAWIRLEDIGDSDVKESQTKLLEEHFTMCLLRYFAASGPNLEYDDTYRHSYAIYSRFRTLNVDLSQECWYRSAGGRNALELYLAMRLYVAAPLFGAPDETNLTRWPPKRFMEAAELQTPVGGQIWPETFAKQKKCEDRRPETPPSIFYGLDQELTSEQQQYWEEFTESLRSFEPDPAFFPPFFEYHESD